MLNTIRPKSVAGLRPVLAVLGLLWCARVASAQDGSDNPVYQSTIAEAVEEFAAGRWAEARALFKRAHGMAPNARTLRGMGMCAYELRMYVPALRELQAALQERRRPLDEAQRVQVNQLIAQASNFIGRFHVTLVPEDAQIVVDAKPTKLDPGNLLFLELGEHQIEVTKNGYEPFNQRVRVEGMETRELRIELKQPTPAVAAAPPPGAPVAGPAPTQAPEQATAPAQQPGGNALAIWGWVSVGVAVVATGSGVWFWLEGERLFDEMKGHCEDSVSKCTTANYEELQIPLADTLATASFITAGVTGALGLTLITIDLAGGSEEQATRAGTQLAVGPGSVTVSGSF